MVQNMTRSFPRYDMIGSTDNVVNGYFHYNGIQYLKDDESLGLVAPAGDIVSSVNDASKWLSTWLNKGQYNGQTIFSESYYDDALKAGPIILDESGTTYGYGWNLTEYKNHAVVEHGGNIHGFSTTFAVYPDDNIGIVVFSNQQVSPIPSTIRLTLTDLLFDLETEDWGAILSEWYSGDWYQDILTELEKNRTLDTEPSLPIDAYAGYYEGKAFGKVSVTTEEKDLMTTADMMLELPSGKLGLKHYADDVYQVLFNQNEASEYLLAFVVSEDGTSITGVTANLEPELEPYLFERISEEEYTASLLLKNSYSQKQLLSRHDLMAILHKNY